MGNDSPCALMNLYADLCPFANLITHLKGPLSYAADAGGRRMPGWPKAGRCDQIKDGIGITGNFDLISNRVHRFSLFTLALVRLNAKAIRRLGLHSQSL